MIKLNHTCHDISLWDLSQPNSEGFWSKMSHFQEELGSLRLLGERLSSPSPVRAQAGSSPGSAIATLAASKHHALRRDWHFSEIDQARARRSLAQKLTERTIDTPERQFKSVRERKSNIGHCRA